MKLSEFESLQERVRLAGEALQKAEAENQEAAVKYETEKQQGLQFSQEARVAEVNLMNSKAEEDRCVKERAAVEGTAFADRAVVDRAGAMIHAPLHPLDAARREAARQEAIDQFHFEQYRHPANVARREAIDKALADFQKTL